MNLIGSHRLLSIEINNEPPRFTSLWEKIAARRPEFGQPSAFADHIDESKSISFTPTLRDPTFFGLVRDITGNLTGEGGLVTLVNSSCLAPIVLPHQPNFIGQPKDVAVFWGYGLFVSLTEFQTSSHLYNDPGISQPLSPPIETFFSTATGELLA